MTQLPVKNTFIEVRAQDPIIVRPRAHTAEVVASPSYLASSVEIAPAPVSAVAPGVPAVSVDSKVRTVPGAAACAISTGDSIRRCSVTRTPEVLYARTPVGSIAAEPPYAFALPQAIDEHGRRRTSTFGTEAARVQTGHSSATRRSSLETIPATPDLYYSWPPPNPAPPPVVMLPSAVPEGSTQVAQALPQLATHGMPILQCPPSHCQVQMPLQATPSETSYTQPVAHTVSAQYPSLGHQFAAPPIPLGSHAPLPPQWDAPLHFIPQNLSPMVQEPGKPIHKAAAPAWPAQPGKYQTPGGPVPQQVLVLSNFLQEAPRKLEAQLPAEVQDPAPGGITTLMLRNIPVTFNRESLLADFDARGFRGKYDFFYLPIDFQTDNNLGYAFINLATPMYAEHFRSTYQGLALAGDRSKKICAVAPATTQGRAANVEYYRNSNVMSMEDKYQPLVFENGLRAPFPAPTKAVKPIRYRESRGMGPE